MQAISEFQGIDHVTIHIPGEDGEPLCEGRREAGNELFGPHEIDVTPDHIDVCPNCREVRTASERDSFERGNNAN